jgi:hypothetical protein
MLVRSWLAWVSAPALCERPMIGYIENMIDCTINSRKDRVGTENNKQHITKRNFVLKG